MRSSRHRRASPVQRNRIGSGDDGGSAHRGTLDARHRRQRRGAERQGIVGGDWSRGTNTFARCNVCGRRCQCEPARFETNSIETLRDQ